MSLKKILQALSFLIINKCKKAYVSPTLTAVHKDAFPNRKHFFGLSLERRKLSKKNICTCTTTNKVNIKNMEMFIFRELGLTDLSQTE